MPPIYNTIGTHYNSTRQADAYLTQRLYALLQPAPGKTYLDIGCGTGNYTIALSKMGVNFTGIEPAENMLSIARCNSQQVNWVFGSAEDIPANNDTFDGAIATLTIHHWADMEKAMHELYRVCKNQTKIVFFTATPVQMEGYWLNYYFPKMLALSAEQMPSYEKVKQSLEKAGFEITEIEKYDIQDDLQDLFLYSGKNKPEIYLDAAVRNGISSFAALAHAEEVMAGLARLTRDIENGEFNAVKRAYDNDKGDYLFIVAKKQLT